jgi:3-deoxy-manno-octulosonate cytidylyltransferase (CMP-KDO synthetase)
MGDFHVIIPARYNSERFPGKALVEINKKPILQHVYDRAIQSGAISVTIATDDERIAKVASGFGAKVCMTNPDHVSGTDRVAEAAMKGSFEDNEIIVNVQGDEPLIPPKAIYQVASNLDEHDNIKVATLCEPITSAEDLLNPNIVKVVMNQRNHAVYFSRAPIPWDRDKFPLKKDNSVHGSYYRHRGIYAFRVGFLMEFVEWRECPLEAIERLEQLRTLWHGGRIHVDVSKEKIPPDINTKEDLALVTKLFSKSSRRL